MSDYIANWWLSSKPHTSYIKISKEMFKYDVKDDIYGKVMNMH